VIKNDRQKGRPFGDYTDSKSNIEAIQGLVGGETAYSLEGQWGYYNYVTGAWVWITHAGGGVSNHNDLSGLQGGTSGEYYHLSSAQYLGLYSGSYPQFVTLDSTNQLIAGIKSFLSFPITPSSAPTTNYQVANKKYVDDSNLETLGSKLAFVQLSSSKADIYDSGANYGYVKSILFFNSNTSLTPEVVSINLHDGTNEYELYRFELEPFETLLLEFPKSLPINASSKLTGNTTTASKVTCLVGGYESASELSEKVLAFVQLASSKSDVYDSGANTGMVHHILMHNINTSVEISTLYLHDGTNEYAITKVSLEDDPRETVEFSFPETGMIVNSSSKITGLSTTATKVTCLIIGTER